jgi:hypothetical protein
LNTCCNLQNLLRALVREFENEAVELLQEMAAPSKRRRTSESTRRRFLAASQSSAFAWLRYATGKRLRSYTRRAPLPILDGHDEPEMVGRRLCGRVEAALERSTTYASSEEVTSIIWRVREVSSKEL